MIQATLIAVLVSCAACAPKDSADAAPTLAPSIGVAEPAPVDAVTAAVATPDVSAPVDTNAPTTTPVRGDPHTVASAEGQQGRIEVIDRDGLRRLKIRGDVQGATTLGSTGTPLPGDPAVQLVRALRPEARTALVIGLGTGRTAAELSAAGFEVEAVELEPKVVEFARAHFDYRGHAAVADGIDWLDANERT